MFFFFQTYVCFWGLFQISIIDLFFDAILHENSEKKVENLKNTITCKSAVTKSRLDIIYSVYRTKKQVEFRKSDK